MKLTQIQNSFRYLTEDGYEVKFRDCMIGKHKGKTFMLNCGSDKATEVEILKYHDKPTTFGCGYIRIVEEVKELQDYFYSDVFCIAKKARFYLTDEPVYDGYTFNNHWNGWEMPMFTKEIAEKILQNTECIWSYDSENDTFTYRCCDDEEDNNIIEKGHNIDVDNGDIVHVYDIGSGSWIWDEE